MKSNAIQLDNTKKINESFKQIIKSLLENKELEIYDTVYKTTSPLRPIKELDVLARITPKDLKSIIQKVDTNAIKSTQGLKTMPSGVAFEVMKYALDTKLDLTPYKMLHQWSGLEVYYDTEKTKVLLTKKIQALKNGLKLCAGVQNHWNTEKVKNFLYDNPNIDTNITNKSGYTALVYALCQRNEELFKVLVKAGADINVVASTRADTMLHLAANFQMPKEFISWLISNMTDPMKKNNKGETFVDYLNGNKEFAEKLVQEKLVQEKLVQEKLVQDIATLQTKAQEEEQKDNVEVDLLAATKVMHPEIESMQNTQPNLEGQEVNIDTHEVSLMALLPNNEF